MSTQFAFAETNALPFGTGPSNAGTTASRTRSAGKAAPSANRSQQKNVDGVRRTRKARQTSVRGTDPRSTTKGLGQWRLDEGTKQAGRAGIASAREAIASARRHQFDSGSDITELPEAA